MYHLMVCFYWLPFLLTFGHFFPVVCVLFFLSFIFFPVVILLVFAWSLVLFFFFIVYYILRMHTIKFYDLLKNVGFRSKVMLLADYLDLVVAWILYLLVQGLFVFDLILKQNLRMIFTSKSWLTRGFSEKPNVFICFPNLMKFEVWTQSSLQWTSSESLFSLFSFLAFDFHQIVGIFSLHEIKSSPYDWQGWGEVKWSGLEIWEHHSPVTFSHGFPVKIFSHSVISEHYPLDTSDQYNWRFQLVV